MNVCCSHKGTMTSKSALQHRSCQSASLTDQSCCAEQSRKQIAGLCHCKFTCERSLLTQRQYDQQVCTPVTDHVLHAKMHPSLIRAVVQKTARQQACFTANFSYESLLLAQRHCDQQECTAAQILPKCNPH